MPPHLHNLQATYRHKQMSIYFVTRYFCHIPCDQLRPVRRAKSLKIYFFLANNRQLLNLHHNVSQLSLLYLENMHVGVHCVHCWCTFGLNRQRIYCVLCSIFKIRTINHYIICLTCTREL